MPVERPNRNVYILGAGFSAPVGAPVIRTFLDRSRELYTEPTSSMDEEERERFLRVFKFKRSMGQAREKFAIDLDDIEKLFGLVEISQRLREGLGETGGEREDLSETRDAVVYLIAKTLRLAIDWPTISRPRIWFGAKPSLLNRIRELRNIFQEESEGRFSVDMYDYFGAIISGDLDDPERRRNRKDTIITFNYDLVCEQALQKLGVEPTYHLKPDPIVDWELATRTVDILKLHGSVNWGICAKCRRQIAILPKKFAGDPSGFRTLSCPECKAGTYQPLMIPPSWDKSEYKDIFTGVWKKALEELREATRICIIGYSLPEVDAFFQYLLTLALSKNEALTKLIVVDLREQRPNAEEQRGTSSGVSRDLETKYRGMLDPMFQERRFFFHANGVQRFLGDYTALSEIGRGEAVGGGLSCTR